MEKLYAVKHWAFFVPFIFGCFFVFIICLPFMFGVGSISPLILIPLILIIGYAILLYKLEILEVKENCLYSRRGIISIKEEKIPLEKISYLSVEKNIIGMLLGFGTIVVQSSAISSTIKFPYIKNPNEFVDKVNSLKQN